MAGQTGDPTSDIRGACGQRKDAAKEEKEEKREAEIYHAMSDVSDTMFSVGQQNIWNRTDVMKARKFLQTTAPRNLYPAWPR